MLKDSIKPSLLMLKVILISEGPVYLDYFENINILAISLNIG